MFFFEIFHILQKLYNRCKEGEEIIRNKKLIGKRILVQRRLKFLVM